VYSCHGPLDLFAPMVLVPAAGLALLALTAFLENIFLKTFPTGMIVHLANHGAPQTLTTILNGNKAFTIA